MSETRSSYCVSRIVYSGYVVAKNLLDFRWPGFWEYNASTAIKMRNVRYLVASKAVMWYNKFAKGEKG
jgi:hypothetical protein